MQVLMLCYEYPPIGGGGGKVAAGLSSELVRLGVSVDFLTMRFRGIPAEREVNGVKVMGVPSLRLRKEICSPFEMATYLANALPLADKLIRHKRYDLIHAHFIVPDGLLAYFLKRRSGLPYILTAHGSDVPAYNPHRFRMEHKIFLPVWRRVVQESAVTVTASAHLTKLIRQQLPQQAVERIHHAIPKRELSRQPKDPHRILVVSRLLERKGVQFLLQALDDITIPYQVDIIGAGPYRAKLERLSRSIRGAAKITFHGWVDQEDPQFWRFFESAAIFVFPSEAENFPNVLLEAMAAGMAIITTDDTGCAEVVGDSAFLVPPANPAAIRQALLQLNEHPHLLNELCQRAYRRMQENFSWEIAAQRYHKLYQRVKQEASTA